MTDCMYPDICYLFASYHASCKRNTHQTATNIGTLEYEPIKLEEKSEKSKVKLEEVQVPARLRERLPMERSLGSVKDRAEGRRCS